MTDISRSQGLVRLCIFTFSPFRTDRPHTRTNYLCPKLVVGRDPHRLGDTYFTCHQDRKIGMDEMCGESVAQGHSSKPEWDLTARERTLLRALAAEPTMQAVAESVHLSERQCRRLAARIRDVLAVSYTHLRAHETDSYLVCR